MSYFGKYADNTVYVKSAGLWVPKALGVANGFATLDASTKLAQAQAPSYVNDIIVKARITANVSLASLPSTTDADTLTISNGDLVLLTEQSTATQNGVYLASGGALVRSILLTGASAAGARVWVDQGYYWQKTRWQCLSNSGADVVDTNTLTWKRQATLLDDLPFDASDQFSFFNNEPLNVQTHTDTVTDAVAGSQTLSAYASGHGALIIPGPFNGSAGTFYDSLGIGYSGPGSGFPLVAPFTISFWLRFRRHQTAYSSTFLSFWGRSRVSLATITDDVTGLAAMMSTTSVGNPGGVGDIAHDCQFDLNRSGGGSLDTAKVGPWAGSQGSAQRADMTTNGQWVHHAITMDTTSSAFLVWTNGFATGGSTGTQIATNTGGFWWLGRPTATSSFGSAGAFDIARFRLSNVVRADAWIHEQYRRGMAWLN